MSAEQVRQIDSADPTSVDTQEAFGTTSFPFGRPRPTRLIVTKRKLTTNQDLFELFLPKKTIQATLDFGGSVRLFFDSAEWNMGAETLSAKTYIQRGTEKHEIAFECTGADKSLSKARCSFSSNLSSFNIQSSTA